MQNFILNTKRYFFFFWYKQSNSFLYNLTLSLSWMGWQSLLEIIRMPFYYLIFSLLMFKMSVVWRGILFCWQSHQLIRRIFFITFKNNFNFTCQFWVLDPNFLGLCSYLLFFFWKKVACRYWSSEQKLVTYINH